MMLFYHSESKQRMPQTTVPKSLYFGLARERIYRQPSRGESTEYSHTFSHSDSFWSRCFPVCTV